MIATAALTQKNLLCLPTTTVHSKVEELTTSPSSSFLTIKCKNDCIFLFKLKKHIKKTSEIIDPGYTKENTLNMDHNSPEKNNSNNQVNKQSLDTNQENPLLLKSICCSENQAGIPPQKHTSQNLARLCKTRQARSRSHIFKILSNWNFYRAD